MDSFERDGLVFDVRDSGPQDGPVVVLLHGVPENASSWDRVVPSLDDAGYRTLVPDQRGYSRRARPDGRRPYRLPELADDVVALIDHSGSERAHVVGHDWGGAIAWAVGGWHADRVQTLTSVSTPHLRAFLRPLITSSQGVHSWYMLALQIPWLPERLMLAERRGSALAVKQLVGSGLPEDLARRYIDHLSEPGALRAAINWYRAAPLVSPSRMPARISLPTLYVWSTRDTFLSRKSAELTARYVTGPYRFEVLEDANHWIPETESDRLVPLLLDHFNQ